MAELRQRTLGLVRDALFEMQPDGLLTTYEKSNFWKQRLFDAEFPQNFIDVAKSYGFQWTDIVPALYTGRFGEQNVHFAKLVSPADCEFFLRKLIVFAVEGSSDTDVGDRLQRSLSDDSFNVGGATQTETSGELTKLPNRESLLADLTVRMKEGELLSLVFIDLDNFKQVNDQHGHSEGDRCLAEVAAQISDVIIGKGRLYRVGGDEFCVNLPNFTRFEAGATAERIRNAVDSLEPFGGATKVTTSIGVVASDALGKTDPEQLVQAADEAMYVSKWTTKNRVTIWPSEEANRRLAERNRQLAKSGQRLTSAEQPNQQSGTEQARAKERLATFLVEGQRIQSSLEYNNTATVHEKTDWERRVDQFLTECLGQSYAIRFRSPKHRVSVLPSGISSPMRRPWADITARMDMIHDFISELRN